MNSKTALIIFMVFCLSIALPATVTAGAVSDEVKATVDQVLKIVSDKDLKKPENKKKRRAELRTVIGRIFDYGEMAKRSMAARWKTLKPPQQKEFTDLFTTLLENSYADKIEAYTNEKILYGKEKVEGDYAEVHSKVITAKRDEHTLDYRLFKKGNKWMIYDVAIEGVSLISNYRTQFNKIIVERGYDELVKKMRTKSEEIASP